MPRPGIGNASLLSAVGGRIVIAARVGRRRRSLVARGRVQLRRRLVLVLVLEMVMMLRLVRMVKWMLRWRRRRLLRLRRWMLSGRGVQR